MGTASVEQHLADVERAKQAADASLMVQKIGDHIIREWLTEHPNDPLADGYRAAVSNLAALTEGGIIRGHLRALEQIAEGQS